MIILVRRGSAMIVCTVFEGRAIVALVTAVDMNDNRGCVSYSSADMLACFII